MIVGAGTDIIEISRIKRAISKRAFIDKVFTHSEKEYYKSRNSRVEILAGNFAVKEAVVKALGVGFSGIGLRDVEVLRDTLGKPYVILHRRAKTMVSDNCAIHISISHCREYATAIAIIESVDKDESSNFKLVIPRSVDRYNKVD